MKQYLLVCDETALSALEATFKNVKFIEVQGLSVDHANKVQVLVTPVIQPLPSPQTDLHAAAVPKPIPEELGVVAE